MNNLVKYFIMQYARGLSLINLATKKGYIPTAEVISQLGHRSGFISYDGLNYKFKEAPYVILANTGDKRGGIVSSFVIISYDWTVYLVEFDSSLKYTVKQLKISAITEKIPISIGVESFGGESSFFVADKVLKLKITNEKLKTVVTTEFDPYLSITI
jgi:hypothetical protein